MLLVPFVLEFEAEWYESLYHMPGRQLYVGRRMPSVAEVCDTRTCRDIVKPLPSYQAVQDIDNGPPKLHYLLIE